jgi:hypothetical protein
MYFGSERILAPEKTASYEFGRYMFNDLYLHDRKDHYAVSWFGSRIAEVPKVGADKRVTLVLQKDMTSGVTNRYETLFRNVKIHCRSRQRANGKKHMVMEFFAGSRGAIQRLKVDVSDSLRIDVEVSPTNPEHVVVTPRQDIPVKAFDKDKAKYRAFNKELKTLKALYTAQIKMGAFDFLGQGSDPNSARRYAVSQVAEKFALELARKLYGIGKDYLPRAHWEALQRQCLEGWISNTDRSADATRFLFLTIIRDMYGYGSLRLQETLLARLKSALKAMQVAYLRNHCVTISESNTTLSTTDATDQDSELFEAAGL